jgi:hypothetical protein
MTLRVWIRDEGGRMRFTAIATGALWCIVIGASAILEVSPASAGYSLGWYSTDGTGFVSSAGGYTLRAAAGQPVAGAESGGNYSAFLGFLAAVGGPYTVSVQEPGAGDPALPASLRLRATTPNPLVDHGQVAFDLPGESHVRLRIFDVLGRARKDLVDEVLPAGRYQRIWNVTADDGRRVAPGIYFLILEGPSARIQQRLVVIR